MRKNYTRCALVFFLLCSVLTNFLFHLFTNSFFSVSSFFFLWILFLCCVWTPEPDAPWLESPHLQAQQLLLRPLWRRFVRLTKPRPQMCMYIFLSTTIHHSAPPWAWLTYISLVCFSLWYECTQEMQGIGAKLVWMRPYRAPRQVPLENSLLGE